jgi:hypothetical protein
MHSKVETSQTFRCLPKFKVSAKSTLYKSELIGPSTKHSYELRQSCHDSEVKYCISIKVDMGDLYMEIPRGSVIGKSPHFRVH